MCIICVDIQKNKMTADEGYRALTEMHQTLEPGHADEVEELLFEKMLDDLMLIEDDDASEPDAFDFFAVSSFD